MPILQIEGEWVQESPLPDRWYYSFNTGILDQTARIGGTVVATYRFTYAVRSDTVYIGGDTLNAPRTWVLDHWCDSVVQVRQLGMAIAPVLLLRRE